MTTLSTDRPTESVRTRDSLLFRILAAFGLVIAVFVVGAGLTFFNLTQISSDVHKFAEIAREAGSAAKIEAQTVKGEVVVVVGPPQAAPVSDADITARLETALQDMSLRDAAKAIAEALGVPKSRVYELGLRRPRGEK